MNNKPVTYPLPEGSFLTLAPDADYSVNILKFSDAAGQPYDLIINRTELAEGQTIETFYEMQQERMRMKTPGYTPEGDHLNHEIGPSRLPVLQAANRYLENGVWTSQIMSVIKLPYDPVVNPEQRKIIIMTIATQGEFSEDQRRHYVRIINSFTPLETAAASTPL